MKRVPSLTVYEKDGSGRSKPIRELKSWSGQYLGNEIAQEIYSRRRGLGDLK
jgi:hypothetical protein